MSDDALRRVMDRVEDDIARTLERERSSRDVLNKVIREGAPMFMAYKTRGRVPSLRQLEEIAVMLLAIVTASEEVVR